MHTNYKLASELILYAFDRANQISNADYANVVEPSYIIHVTSSAI